jgi:hypothetical protein
MSDLASDSYLKRQERLRFLSDMSLELWDSNFNVQVSSEVLSRDDKYIVVNIGKRGSYRGSYNRFYYSEIKDVFLSMVSYMKSEGMRLESIDGRCSSINQFNNPLGLKEEELYFLTNTLTQLSGKVDCPIGQLIIKFKE